MSLLKKLAGETAIYGLGSILPRLLNYVALTPYFTYVGVKNTAEYGIFTELYAYIALLNIVLTYRFETAYFRYAKDPAQAPQVLSTLLRFLLISTSIFFVLGWSLAEPAAQWLSYPDHPQYLRWLVAIVALDVLSSIPFAHLRLTNRPVRFATIRIFSVIFNILLIFFFLEFCPWAERQGWSWIRDWYHPNDRIGDVFLANVFSSLLTLLALSAPWRTLGQPANRALLGQVLRYSFPLIIAGIAGTINQLIGTPMLKYFAGGSLEANLSLGGLYGAAAKIPVMMNLFTQAYNYAAEPFFFRHADRGDAQQLYSRVAQAFTLVSCVAFLVIMLYLDVAIAYFVGPNYRSGLGVVPILLLSNLLLGLYYSFSIWYKLTDQTAYASWIALGGAAITLVGNVVLIPWLGIYGPAWAALGCYGFMVAASYWTGQKHYPIPYPLRRMGTYLAIALGGYGAQIVLFQLWVPPAYGWQLLVNTLLLLLCGGLYAWVEWPQLQKLRTQLRSRA